MGGFHGGHNAGGSINGGSGGYGHDMDHGGHHYRPHERYYVTVSPIGTRIFLSVMLIGFGIAMLAIGMYWKTLDSSGMLWTCHAIAALAIIGGIIPGILGLRMIGRRKAFEEKLKAAGIMPEPGSLAPYIIFTAFPSFFVLFFIFCYLDLKEQGLISFIIGLGVLTCIGLIFLIHAIVKHVRYNRYLKNGGLTEDKYEEPEEASQPEQGSDAFTDDEEDLI